MDISVVVDASVWVSWYIQQDVHHRASRLWLDRYTAQGGFLIAPMFLLVEVAGAISRQKGDSKLARQVIKDIYYYDAMRILTLKDTLMWASVEIAADLELRAGDTTYIAVAHQYHLPLVSWDKEQLRKASSLTPTYTPDEYPF